MSAVGRYTRATHGRYANAFHGGRYTRTFHKERSSRTYSLENYIKTYIGAQHPNIQGKEYGIMGSKVIPLSKDTAMIISHNRDGSDTIQLPASNKTVKVIHFEANGFAYVVDESHHSSKLIMCRTKDELIKALSKTKPKKVKKAKADKAEHRSNSKVQKTTEESSSRLSTEEHSSNHSEPNLKEMNSDEFKEYGKVKAKNGVAVDVETGEVAWEYRPIKSLKRVWRKQSYYIYTSAYWKKSVGITVHLDTSPTFEQMSKLVEDFFRHIKRKYKGEFKCGFVFLEPCYDGSWHAHLILNFYDAFPEKFESETKKWWRKFNNVSSLTQIEFSYFSSVIDFENYVNYLNPANVEKKRNRVRYYPKSSQPMRHCGDAEYPNSALAVYDTAKKLVGSDEPTKRTRSEIVDVATNELLSYHTTYHHYTINLRCATECFRDNTEDKDKIIATLKPKRYEQLTFVGLPVPLDETEQTPQRCDHSDYKYAIAMGAYR